MIEIKLLCLKKRYFVKNKRVFIVINLEGVNIDGSSIRKFFVSWFIIRLGFRIINFDYFWCIWWFNLEKICFSIILNEVRMEIF